MSPELFIQTNGSLPDGYKIESHFLDPSGQEVSPWQDWTSHYDSKLLGDGSGVEYAYAFPYVPTSGFSVNGTYTWEVRIVYPDGFTKYQEPYLGRVYLNVANLTAEIQPATWDRSTRCTGSSIVLRIPKINWRMGYLSDGTEVLAYDPILLQLTDGTNTYTSKSDDPKALSEYVEGEWEVLVFQFDQVIPEGTYTGKILDTGTAAEPADYTSPDYYNDMQTKPQLTVGSGVQAVPRPEAGLAPKTLRILRPEQIADGMVQEDTITVTVPGWQFMGSDKRWIEIVRDDSDHTVVVTKTEIPNVVEDAVTGDTTLSYTFSNVTGMAKDRYTVNIYQENCAADPIASGTFVIAERPLKLVFFHDDHLGTPRLITDEDGQTVSIHDYLAYGEEITTADFQTNRMKFTGHERDPETGLDYMLARYYTAGSGRFLQVDPGYDYKLTDPMSFNLYGYVRENPVTFLDNNGKMVILAEIEFNGLDEVRYDKKLGKYHTHYEPFEISMMLSDVKIRYHFEFNTLPKFINGCGEKAKLAFDILSKGAKENWFNIGQWALTVIKHKFGTMNGTAADSSAWLPSDLLTGAQLMQLEANMLQAIVKADLFDSQGNLFFKKDIPLLQQILNEQISQFVANLPVSQSRKAEIASDLETAYDLELLLSTARGEEVAGVTRSGVYIFRDKNGHLHM